MFVAVPHPAEMSEAWLDNDESARWRSRPGHGPGTGARASGSSLLEVDPGCHLPRHTDSAEETVVVTNGVAAVTVDGETARVPAGGSALIPADVAHEVRNDSDELLRFVAIYAEAEVTTTYEHEVQPDGARERSPVG